MGRRKMVDWVAKYTDTIGNREAMDSNRKHPVMDMHKKKKLLLNSPISVIYTQYSYSLYDEADFQLSFNYLNNRI